MPIVHDPMLPIRALVEASMRKPVAAADESECPEPKPVREQLAAELQAGDEIQALERAVDSLSGADTLGSTLDSLCGAEDSIDRNLV